MDWNLPHQLVLPFLANSNSFSLIVWALKDRRFLSSSRASWDSRSIFSEGGKVGLEKIKVNVDLEDLHLPMTAFWSSICIMYLDISSLICFISACFRSIAKSASSNSFAMAAAADPD